MGPSMAERVTARRRSFATLAGVVLAGEHRGDNNMTRPMRVMRSFQERCARHLYQVNSTGGPVT